MQRRSTTVDTERLTLAPLRAADLDRLFAVLDDPTLHDFTGGEPRSGGELADWIDAVAAAGSPDGRERWLNWVVRRRDDDEVVGTVQATVVGDEATIAWVIGSAFQGQGLAKEAGAGMVSWLRAHDGVTRFRATIHPDHLASQAVARSLGLEPTDEVDDGEIVWRTPPARP
jgi:RimJ/RimL family protein N-acetyltransferase